ncbi:MAG: NUDIX hydrolase [Thermoproteota archaeon]|jgi:ADP-ribose pyrophosphatase|nr:NUDIX hydrolase [Thermoproteota archaeon]
MYNVTNSSIVYRSHWLVLYEDRVRKIDGVNGVFNRVSVQDSSIIVPIFKDGSLLMVENYRHGARTTLLELPGGLVDSDEEPRAAARRELLEETGYGSDTLEYVNWNYTWPGRATQKNFVFVAKGLKKLGKPHLEEFEYTRIRKLSKEMVIREIRSGKIRSAISISAILYTLNKL